MKNYRQFVNMEFLENKLFTTKEVTTKISRTSLCNLVKQGKLERVERGVYRTDEYEPSALMEVEILVRRGVKFALALQSALQFHAFTTATPHTVEIALLQGARVPKVNFPLTAYHFSAASWSFGQQKVLVNGINIPVYSPAKTVADLFKFRNKLGLDLALEALREGLRNKRFSVDELIEAAGVNRVQNVIRPYVESYFDL